MSEEKKLDLSFLEGQDSGFENMAAQDRATPLLLIAQALSEVTQAGTVPAGHFYNSVTGRDYGDNLKVVVCHFDKMWYEWLPDQGGLVGRYPVGGLEGVTGDNYSGMMHGKNKVVETWMYLVVLPDYLEDGYMIFVSTPGNLKYLRGWNTQLFNMFSAEGKRMPLYAGVWEMTTGKDRNKAGNQYFTCNNGNGKSSIKFVEWIKKELWESHVFPAREVATKAAALMDNRQQLLDAPTSDDGVPAESDKF